MKYHKSPRIKELKFSKNDTLCEDEIFCTTDKVFLKTIVASNLGEQTK